ncbi:MAG: WD40 repeat domain-containing protein, partial [Nonomuraea sp.]|nr:WD40 repeat domain-containing protein [Nonomuraea sp.]
AGNDRSVYAISDDGERLAALTDGVLRVYDVRTGAQVAGSPGPAQSVRAMAWSPASYTLALIGVDRSYLWTPAGMGPAFGRGLGAPGQQSAWFSPGGSLLFAAARQSGERWAYDLRARRTVYQDQDVVVGPEDKVSIVFDGRDSQVRRGGTSTTAPWLDRMPWEYTVFAPDGEQVAIAEDSGVQIYRLDGVPVLPNRLRPSPGALRFSADGHLLASTDNDRVRVWQVPDGTPVADRQVPTAGVDRPAQARLSPDGRWLRVLAGRGTVLTIDLAHRASGRPPQSVAASICGDYGGLTRAEWNRWLSEVPFRELCP